ncbi:maintenance of mitochondrial structure and function-domain-containing protein [Geranomyces variabilis]|nr:maintenance of mitochondrial structure and function-domain-containing protein [Geranomyces variabilis]KAJ3139685.1 hypothetical protein HDU90_009186 [Geranomyces variabilis]
MASSASFLHLSFPSGSSHGHPTSAAAPVSCAASLGPVVLFSVLDHYLRRPESSTESVYGVLLGVRSEDGQEVDIRSCFPITLKADTVDEIPLVDTDHLTSMYALHQRAAPRETIVGWYATGTTISPANVYIQEFFANETAPHSPVHLLVDPTLNPAQQIASAYVANAVGVPGAAHGQVFVPIPCNVRYSAAEKSSLDLMSKNGGEDSNPLVSDMDALEETVEKVLEMVERVKSYVDSIVGGKEKGHKALGRYLMDMVESVPVIEPKEFEKVFNEHLQDMLMVVYLANLTRTQLAIAERLHKMV